VGKTTFASLAPKPVFILTEEGLGQITVDHFPLCEDFNNVLLCLQSLILEDHDYKTVVIDSMDWVELLASPEALAIYNEKPKDGKRTTLRDIPYGGGNVLLIPFFEKIVEKLNALREKRKMNVVLIAHTKIEKVEDPCGTSYDQYSPRLTKLVNHMIKEWVDIIGFATQKISRTSHDEEFSQKRIVAEAANPNLPDGNRVLILDPSPAIVAKNRYSLPEQMPLDGKKFFDELGKRISGSSAAEKGKEKKSEKAEQPAAPATSREDVLEALTLIYGEGKIPKEKIVKHYNAASFEDLLSSR